MKLDKVVPLLLIALLGSGRARPQETRARRSVPDPGAITTRQTLTPAGVQTVIDGRVYGVAFCGASSNEVSVLASGSRGESLYRLDWKANRIADVMDHSDGRQTPGMQGVTCGPEPGDILSTALSYDPKTRKYQSKLVIISSHNRGQMGSALSASEQSATKSADPLSLPSWHPVSLAGGGQVGGPAVSRDGSTVVVPVTGTNELSVIHLKTESSARQIKTGGIAPFAAVVSSNAGVAYVSNWGGRVPRAGDATATTGSEKDSDAVAVDAHGLVSNGTVSRIDLHSGQPVQQIEVGLHPTAMYWDEPHAKLFVANSNSDTISVIDTDRNVVVKNIGVQPFSVAVHGISPNAIVAGAEGDRLYVACGGINAIAVIDTAEGKMLGLIPTGWYPSHLALSRDGKTLAVATLLGVGSGSDVTKEALDYFHEELSFQPGPERRYVHSYRGTVHVIPIPDEAQLASYTAAAAENNHMSLTAGRSPRAVDKSAKPLAVPVRAGEPSLIDHVVYIVKENRAYDQLFGDLETGNGDPSLELYGEDVVPNHRRLARDFVVLDNFYAAGGNSGDGHQWVTQASETAYCYWPGYSGRGYPFDGTDPIAPASGGFIWDAALGQKRTVQVFGEYAGIESTVTDAARLKELERWKSDKDFVGAFHTVAPMVALNKILATDYPAYGGRVPDVLRARIFQKHLETWERDGKMPNLVIVQLPSDHTGGKNPGYSTPKAAMADNDLALGQIVENLSKSPFWKSMAIFVVEDDAQGGVDHVDGHRTIALAISPYIRRGSVDSTFYSHPSMLKTMELMLGLPTLSLFDLIANDMRNSFVDAPDYTPYTAVMPQQSLFEMNPPVAALHGIAKRDAIASSRMNWRVPDAAPSEELNRILWRDAKGLNTPYPAARKGALLLAAGDDQDQDDEDENKRQKKP